MQRMSAIPSASAGLVVLLLVAGCIGPVAPEPVIDKAEAFILDIQIISLDDGTRKTASGHHCGDVRTEGNVMTVGLWPHEEAPPDFPLLAVYLEIPDGWSTTGTQPFKTAIPATIEPVHGDTPIAAIRWESAGADNGTLYVNEEGVELPYIWSVTGEDSSWRAHVTLTAWHGSIGFERYAGGCF